MIEKKDRRKLKRLKRKVREAEDRINRQIIQRMKEIRDEELGVETKEERQLKQEVMGLLKPKN